MARASARGRGGGRRFARWLRRGRGRRRGAGATDGSLVALDVGAAEGASPSATTVDGRHRQGPCVGSRIRLPWGRSRPHVGRRRAPRRAHQKIVGSRALALRDVRAARTGPTSRSSVAELGACVASGEVGRPRRARDRCSTRATPPPAVCGVGLQRRREALGSSTSITTSCPPSSRRRGHGRVRAGRRHEDLPSRGALARRRGRLRRRPRRAPPSGGPLAASAPASWAAAKARPWVPTRARTSSALMKATAKERATAPAWAASEGAAVDGVVVG